MGKRIRKGLLIPILAGGLLLVPLPSSAVNSGPTCTFEKGTTTCVTIHGSKGDASEHQGSAGSSGTSKNDPPPCKVTGSDHTC